VRKSPDAFAVAAFPPAEPLAPGPPTPFALFAPSFVDGRRQDVFGKRQIGKRLNCHESDN
jgi:hypothetical protein